ncbi:MAG TPA: DUF4214 domain-containing protein [Pirellulales bacterium]|nr:DUF4214 domain-containing protein [Pirellulales bacterium]
MRRVKLDRHNCELLEPRLLLTADLAITKAQIAPLSAGVPAAVSQGEMIGYQITVANNGSTAASGTTLTDTLPAGETLLGANNGSTGASLPFSGDTLSDNLGSLAAGASATLTIDALVNGQAAGTLTNTASVSSADENGGLPIVSAPVSTTIDLLASTAASLSITKTAANDNSVVSVGGGETYTITVANNSANAADNTTVFDVLPAGATFVSGTVSGGTGPTTLSAPTGNLETIDLGTLAANSSATITMAVTAPSSVGVMVNQATVATSSGNTTVANASASLTTAVQGTTAPTSGTVDLSVTKSLMAGTNPALGLGTNATYVVTVTNNGTADATGVVVSDVLPVGAQFISGTTSVSGVSVTSSNGVATATLPTLAAGSSATLTLTLSTSAVGALTDSVYVEGNQPDASQADNVATAATLVNGLAAPAVDLSVTKTASATTGTVGADLTYTITVANSSANVATGVVAEDVLPPSSTFVSATTSTGGSLSPVNGVLVDSIGTLAASGTETLTVTVKPTAVRVITNQAFVAGDQLDTDLSNNLASLTTAVEGTSATNVNLAITKTAANNNADVTLGANETYTITVKNIGTNDATGVVVSDVLPATAGFVSGVASVSGATVADINGTITADLGTLAAGASATLTLTVTPTMLGAITDTAYVEANETDTDQSDNSATVTTSIVSPTTLANLSILKVTAPDPGTVGLPLTYTLIVTNTGLAAADNVVVSDTLPSGVTFASATSDVSGVTPTNSSGSVTADLGTVASGAVETVTIVVTPTAAGTLDNTATVTTSTTNVSTNTSSTTHTTINAVTSTQANLSIAKFATPNPDTVGQLLTYTLVVTNTGAAADNVVVSDTLPSGVNFASATSDVSGVTPTNSSGTVTADLGTVASGAVDTVTIVVTPTAAGTVNNTATVATSTTNVSTHTSATTGTTINPAVQANLSIAKLASPSPDTVGQNLTYVLIVSNAGPAAAADVTVSDTLPSGVTFVSDGSDVSGATLTNTNGTITANLGTVASGAVDTVTIVVTPTAAGTISNTATVSTTTANPGTHTSATVQTTINPTSAAANLSISKTASPSPDVVGQDLTYTIVVSDAPGAADAAGVTVTDALPAGATFVSALDTTSGVSLSPTSGTLSDNIGTVAAGTSDTITITVTPTVTGTLSNTANVTTTTPNISTQTSATVLTMITTTSAAANLSITKTASPSPATVGQDLTYTIVVTNAAGAAAADNVFVIDTLPVGLATLVSAQDTTRGVALTATGAAIKDDIGSMAAGTSDTIVIVATPLKTGQITNTATVHTTTPNASNNTTAVVKTPVNAVAPPAGPSAYLNGQTGDGTDQTFLTNLYRELLDRNPDQTGFQYWLNFLQTNGGTTASGQSNAATRQQVVQIMLHSQEYETHWVDAVFDNFLTRRADPGAEKFFVNELNNGVSEQDVLVAVLTSQEYFGHGGPHGRGAPPGHGPAAGGSNEAFVDNLFAELLGRAADTASEQFYVNALDSGQLTRAQVALDFLNSPEEAHDLMIAAGAGPVGAPGTPATGSYPLAVLTGDGWDDLYFQGNLDSSAVDQFMSALETNTSWQTVQQQMLTLPQYFGG